ncbi:DUF4251 domain-containing protein [Chitinophaga sp. Mgbs1]|uniref:DUF4251 domain-containing protein n=1 Tax=Chitinophaga solisilvae TaxID=1233460 RepID=A0A3S1AXG2_9BACT|nr:DUF4251 domain-containing protein [Chitinophaga solisilvae]
MNSSFAIKTLFLLSMAVSSLTGLHAQETKAEKRADKKAVQQAAVKSLIDGRNYVFIAQSALPMSGRVRQLTPDFNLTVTADSIISYLPYFGRAYSAPYGSTRSPLDFKSKQFDYNAAPGKKDGWNITIRPKDQQDIQTISLTVSSDGYASAQVTSNNRQPISFNGVIQAVPPVKKKKK